MSKIVRLIEKRKHKYVKKPTDKVSFAWLWQHLPVEYWLWLITILILAFIFGFSLCYLLFF